MIKESSYTKILNSLRPFLKHLGPHTLKVISFKELLKESTKLSKKMLSKKEMNRLKEHQAKLLKEDVTIVDEIQNPLKAKDISDSKDLGELFLFVYFKQLFSKEDVFLDLRHTNFEGTAKDLKWKPNLLHYSFTPTFREGLLKVYEGLHDNQEESLNKGLEKMGLLDETSSKSQKKQVHQLIQSHIGKGSMKSVEFKLEHMSESMDNFLSYLKKESVTLPSDFVFFGVYLISLYLTLDNVKKPLNVSKAYQKAKNSV